jgi:hypothetical protein
MAVTDAQRDEFRQIVDKVLPVAMKLKKKMLDKSITWAKTPCPECGGWLHGRIVGRRQHLHMACENADCFMRIME